MLLSLFLLQEAVTITLGAGIFGMLRWGVLHRVGSSALLIGACTVGKSVTRTRLPTSRPTNNDGNLSTESAPPAAFILDDQRTTAACPRIDTAITAG
jgi:hypothetical protein